MSIQAKMICDSVSNVGGTTTGIRLSTIQVTMPKFLLAQLNTHRMFSRNAASSRAIPTSKVIERVQTDPVIPIFWGKNKPGMQATEETDQKGQAQLEWELHSGEAISSARELVELKVHKQIANRLLEPFMYVDVLITATEWQNFFDLRLHDSTQPEMREVALAIQEAFFTSIPHELKDGEWHLPYVNFYQQWNDEEGGLETALKCSVARCARVSYLNHDASNPDLKKDLELYELLHKEKHLSPFEHQATPMDYDIHAIQSKGVTHMTRNGDLWSGNFKGWIQNRQLLTT